MALITVPLLGYAPDLDPAQPGVMSYSYGMVAGEYGWVVAQTTGSGYPTISVAANSYLRDGYAAYSSAGDKIITLAYYDGTAAKVKLLAVKSGEGTIVDVSRAANYSTTTNFSFCQYGLYALATNLTDVLQIRDATSSSTDFADSAATGIPKAKICVTWGPPTSPRVMLLHYNDGTEYGDGWWSSHQGGPTAAWTPDIATGAANGRLLGAGVITCGIAMGDNIVVFSDRSMWIGRFVGPPTVVEWQQISSQIGCVGMYAATVANGLLYFVNVNGLYVFDGNSLPRPVDVPIQSFVRSAQGFVTSTKRWITLVTDEKRNILHVVFRQEPAAGAALYSMIRVNLSNKKASADIAVQPAGHKLWLDENWTVTIDSNVVTINQNWYINSTHVVGDLVGIGLNYIGSNKGDTKLLRVIPRFTVNPSSYSMVNTYGATFGTVTTANTAVSVTGTPWRADIAQTARWHIPRIYLATAGSTSPIVVDVMLEVEKAGNQ